jgi:hypothetical protein
VFLCSVPTTCLHAAPPTFQIKAAPTCAASRLHYLRTCRPEPALEDMYCGQSCCPLRSWARASCRNHYRALSQWTSYLSVFQKHSRFFFFSKQASLCPAHPTVINPHRDQKNPQLPGKGTDCIWGGRGKGRLNCGPCPTRAVQGIPLVDTSWCLQGSTVPGSSLFAQSQLPELPRPNSHQPMSFPISHTLHLCLVFW